MSLKNHKMMPVDATPEEEEFLEFAICNLYKSLDTNEDRFLVAFIHELGYKKGMAANIFGLSPASITSRLQAIEQKLANGYAKKRIQK